MIGKKIKRGTLILIILLMSMNMVSFGEESLSLSISSESLQMGVSSNLILRVSDMNGAELQGISGIENFDILGSSQSTSTSIVNGSTSYTIEVEYSIMPQELGDYKLKAFVKYDGVTYETNEISVSVSDRDESSYDSDQDIYVRTTLSKEDAYFGEKIVLTYELYSRYNIVNYGFTDDIALNGFISKEVEDNSSNGEYITIDGNQYVKYQAKQLVLTPTSIGNIKVPSFNFVANVSTGDFFGSSKPFYLTTEEKEVNIKQIPADGKPHDYSGLVGRPEMKAVYSGDSMEYGDSINLNVLISGDCNLELLESLEANIPDSFTSYVTEKDLEEKVASNGYTATKEYEIILVAQDVGEITIDPMEIAYFDVVSGTYEKLTVPSKTINVTGELDNQSQVDDNYTSLIEKNEPIYVNQLNVNSSDADDNYFHLEKTKVYIVAAIIIAIVLLLLVVFIYKKKRGNLREDDETLSEIYKKTSKVKEDDEYYNILNDMIKYKYDISLKAVSREDIIKSIDDETMIEDIFHVMDYFESRYSSDGNNDINLKEKIKNVYKLLK